MNNSIVFASTDDVINPITRLRPSRKGVQTVVIGDVRDIRQGNDVGSANNQKIHQWSFGSVRHKLTYKAERRGMVVALQDEHATTRRCPVCRHLRKSRVAGRVFHCTNKRCGFTWHRDGVGAINIRQKYLGCGPANLGKWSFTLFSPTLLRPVNYAKRIHRCA